MKKQKLKNLKLNKNSVAGFNTVELKGGLSGWCDPSEGGPTQHNPMNSRYRSRCFGCEESFGILCRTIDVQCN
ncbi:hypothetical protein [Kordia sp.]|uniref:hypothetical protein n=1 Tax=Kordia sp. TaxID=1965332 RepID=UPI003D2D9008